MQFISDIFKYDFLQRSLLAALLASIACGILGAYSLVRRNSYMTGAVSHSLLGGIGLARYLCVCAGLSFATPILGATLSAIVASVIITVLPNLKKVRTDTVLSGVWTVSVALGICLVAAIPGYAEDLNSYLFGNILLISNADLLFMAGLDLLIVLSFLAFRTRFIAFCFQREMLTLRGISPFWTELLLNLLSALAIVLLVQLAGIVMALALFTLPIAAAAHLCKKLNSIMLVGGIFCLASTTLGLAISYAPEWHTGAVTIIVAAAIYVITALIRK